MEMERRVLRSSFFESVVRSTPLKSTLPPVGLSSRFRHRTKVDLPAPDRPIMPKISPFSILRDTFFTASTAPSAPEKVLLTFTSSSIASSKLKKKSGSSIPGHVYADLRFQRFTVDTPKRPAQFQGVRELAIRPQRKFDLISDSK